MSSEKVPEKQIASERRGSRAVLVRLVIFLGFVVVVPVSLVVWEGMRTASLDENVDQAAVLIAEAIDAQDNAKRKDLAQQAQRLLSAFPKQLPPHKDAHLLRVAAMLAVNPRAEFPPFAVHEETSTLSILLVAQTLYHIGRISNADDLVAVALERGDERERTLRLATLIGFDLGREDEVLEMCEELTKLAPDDSRPWLVRAQIHQLRNYWPQVAEDLEEVKARDPENRTAIFSLADAYVRVGDAEKARANFDLLDLSPTENADSICFLVARLRHLEGNLDGATELLDFYLKENPGQAEALLLRGRIEFAQQDLAAAEATLKKVIEIDPISHEAYYTLGQVVARMGKEDEAREYLAKQRSIMDRKTTLYDLERRVGREPGNFALIDELIENCEALGMQEEAAYWRRVRSMQ